MPQRAPGGNDFAAQLEMLQENLKYGVEESENRFRDELRKKIRVEIRKQKIEKPRQIRILKRNETYYYA